MTKYVFITGGVVSGLGKGVVAASLGRLLKQRGVKVAAQKLDPYLNVDPGTMSPYQHGEVFVTEDGAETDLDLGHYERFIDEDLTKYSSLTSGRVYWNVLDKERRGEYLGGTVQVIPHVTDEIKAHIYAAASATGADVLLTEIGGTTGDIESQPFLEAIRQISLEAGVGNCLFIHVTLVPYLNCSHEHKSKPTQHSVKELRSFGISPNIIVARSDVPIARSVLDKIAMFCNVKPDCVVPNIDLDCLYAVPLMLHEKGLDRAACRELGLELPEPELDGWRQMVDSIGSATRRVTVAMVGKYTELHDAYLSVVEALNHAGYALGTAVDIRWIDSASITDENAAAQLKGVGGILIPGGFGNRGIDGMVAACRYARENNVPYLGICLGMQVAVIEFARDVLGFADANSREFDAASSHPVIDLMPDQQGNIPKGGTMRLGSYPCEIRRGSLMERLYGAPATAERHRHRYEYNAAYRAELEAAGLLVSGGSPDGRIAETVELPRNAFFLGVQFHPEFKSRPNRTHPVFRGFVAAALENER